jgi:hypothetical protein
MPPVGGLPLVRLIAASLRARKFRGALLAHRITPLNTTTRADPEHGNETFDLRPFASPLLERNEGAFRLCSPSVEPFQTAILDRLGDVFSVDTI